ncbi:MAG: TIGR03087 family PEP-CTERM/XrtA system glycosyltransferase [Planctomycetota bacterium]
MNILYLAHRLPYPPNKGDKIRSFHQIEYLSRRHRIWCACFVDDPADLVQIDALRNYCHAVAAVPLNRKLAAVRGLLRQLRGGTLTEGIYGHRRMWNTLQSWADDVDFDAVLVFSSAMAPYGLAVAAPRRVIDFCDWDSLKWADYAENHRGVRSLLWTREARRLRRREAQWISEYDAAAVITAAEADDCPETAVRAAGFSPRGSTESLPSRLTVIGNGVELRPYVPPPTAPRIGFVGEMGYPPNVDAVCTFAKHAWPLIRSQVPKAAFQIVGRRPTARVQDLANLPGIEVVGEVPDVGRYVDDCAVHAILLATARGLQNKVLEAMAAGRAVVLSSAAARGIGGQNNRHYLIAESPEGAASAVVALFQNPERASAIGRSARTFVERHFNWDREMAKLETLLVDGAVLLNVGFPKAGNVPCRAELEPAGQEPHGAMSS